jgi:hypothetical protein
MSLYKSELGTDVVQDITFKSVTYTAPDGTQYTTPELKLYMMLLSVVIPKVIVKTAIQGVDGTVKEYIGQDDAQVTISGVLTAKNGERPQTQMQDLKSVVDARVPIRVVCDYLADLNIFELVIQSANFPQKAGGYSTQEFVLNCISDTPVEINFLNA